MGNAVLLDGFCKVRTWRHNQVGVGIGDSHVLPAIFCGLFWLTRDRAVFLGGEVKQSGVQALTDDSLQHHVDVGVGMVDQRNIVLFGKSK